MTKKFRFGAVALLLIGALVLGACGDDDDDTTAGSGSGSGSGSTSEQAAGDTEEFCTDLIEIQSSEPEIPEDATEEEAGQLEEEFFENEFMPQAERIRDAAPEEVREDLTRIVEIFEEKGPGAFEDEEFGRLNTEVNTAAIDLCDAESIEVTAVDYSFQGVPSTIPAGRVGVNFENKGKELHEFVLLRKNDDTTESFDELLELPEEEAMEKVTSGFGAFAFPGSSDSRIIELEAGEYLAVCFIPVGLTPEVAEAAESGGEEPQGPPHFTQGMRAEFTVE